MDSKTFIFQKLAEFSTEFSEFTYKYWADDTQENHFIEVIPSTYKISDEFIDHEVALLELFYSIFFSESLSFISSSDLAFIGKINLIKSIPLSFNWDNNSVNLVSSSLDEVNKYRQDKDSQTYILAIAA